MKEDEIMNVDAELIAKKILDENKKVVIYCANKAAMDILNELKTHWNTKPVCLCDSNSLKWHKYFSDVETLSPDEVISKFPDAYYYIASEIYKYQIIGYLVFKKNISPDRIINYEPVYKRTSCIYLESSVVCVRHTLCFCCSDFGKNKSPYIAFNGDYDLAAQEFITYRDKLINDLNNGIPTPCDGCPYIKLDWYPSNRKIMLFNDGEDGMCNFDCSYCRSNAKTAADTSDDIISPKLINAFSNLNVLSENLQTIISCGEITVHPYRHEIYESIREFQNSICTNASICDQNILRLLELGNTNIVVSVDAGTESTFFKVKGYNLYNKVCKNLKRYSESGPVHLKYIVLPGINDNKADIDGFINLCKDIDAKYVQIAHDLYSNLKLTEESKKMICYFIDQLSVNGFSYGIISNVINDALTNGNIVK